MLYYAVAAGIAIVAAASGYFISRFTTETPAPVADTPANPAQGVDLANMTPREAADRLFNRIVRASEQGDMEEARRFAPMALQAYALVDGLDADAHYHLGLIHLIAGDVENARKEADTLKQSTPDHLLAYMLEHSIAEQSGDRAAAAAAFTAFTAAYDAEIKTQRPEYEAHRAAIERFRSTGARPQN